MPKPAHYRSEIQALAAVQSMLVNIKNDGYEKGDFYRHILLELDRIEQEHLMGLLNTAMVFSIRNQRICG